MAWPAVKQAFTQEQFGEYVKTLVWQGWRPSLVVWHNTAEPSLAQWEETAAKDKDKGIIPGTTRIGNLERYYRDEKGWSGGPHLFIAPDFIWVFNSLTAAGVHSPSWNSISFGFEMVGNFEAESPDEGSGLEVKNHCIFATAVLCTALGLDVSQCIRLHKEDPRTTHACPGTKIAIEKSHMMRSVMDLMSGGEHSSVEVPPPPRSVGRVTIDRLNFRRGPGIQNESTGSLPSGTEVVVLDKVFNGTSEWLKVRTPAGYVGWVAGKFVINI